MQYHHYLIPGHFIPSKNPLCTKQSLSISLFHNHLLLLLLLSLQSCPTLCDPIDGSPSGSPVPGILQARTLEWGAIAFSNAWKWKVKVKSLSHVGLLATPWTAAYHASPSMGFSRQEYWSGVPLPSPYGYPSGHEIEQQKGVEKSFPFILKFKLRFGLQRE